MSPGKAVTVSDRFEDKRIGPGMAAGEAQWERECRKAAMTDKRWAKLLATPMCGVEDELRTEIERLRKEAATGQSQIDELYRQLEFWMGEGGGRAEQTPEEVEWRELSGIKNRTAAKTKRIRHLTQILYDQEDSRESRLELHLKRIVELESKALAMLVALEPSIGKDRDVTTKACELGSLLNSKTAKP